MWIGKSKARSFKESAKVGLLGEAARQKAWKLQCIGKVSTYALAFVGVLILAGDVVGDLSFFATEANRTTALMGSALLRNSLTLAAVISLFLEKKIGAYLIVIAALLGMFRRAQFLSPLFALSASDAFLMIHSGADAVFRLLLLAAGIGWLVKSKGEE